MWHDISPEGLVMIVGCFSCFKTERFTTISIISWIFQLFCSVLKYLQKISFWNDPFSKTYTFTILFQTEGPKHAKEGALMVGWIVVFEQKPEGDRNGIIANHQSSRFLFLSLKKFPQKKNVSTFRFRSPKRIYWHETITLPGVLSILRQFKMQHSSKVQNQIFFWTIWGVEKRENCWALDNGAWDNHKKYNSPFRDGDLNPWGYVVPQGSAIDRVWINITPLPNWRMVRPFRRPNPEGQSGGVN